MHMRGREKEGEKKEEDRNELERLISAGERQ